MTTTKNCPRCFSFDIPREFEFLQMQSQDPITGRIQFSPRKVLVEYSTYVCEHCNHRFYTTKYKYIYDMEGADQL